MKKAALIFISIAFALTLNAKVPEKWNPSQIEKVQKLNDASYCFAAMGDSHGVNETFKGLFKKIDADPQIKFAVDNGDIVHNGKESEYREVLKAVRKFKKPVIMGIGNHDVQGGGRKYYEKYIGPAYFHFDIGDASFFILDMSAADGASFGDDQRRWLEAQMKDAQNKKYRIVFFHIPLFEARIFPFDPQKYPARVTVAKVMKSYGLKNRKLAFELMELFEKYNVSHIFCGHNHASYSGTWGGVPFTIASSAGGKLKGRDPKNEFYHYVKACLKDGKVDMDVIRLENN